MCLCVSGLKEGGVLRGAAQDSHRQVQGGNQNSISSGGGGGYTQEGKNLLFSFYGMGEGVKDDKNSLVFTVVEISVF